jgi:acyl carrier protein
MNSDEAHTEVAAALARIAPELDLAEIDPTGDLREQADLDSMDVLELVARLSDRTGLSIPEDDLDRLESLEALVGYLVARTTSTPQSS